MTAPNRALWWGGLAVVLLVVIAGAFVAAQDEPQFDAGSPEAAAQGYLAAMFDGDYREAHGYLAPDLADACRVSDLRFAWVPDTGRVVLLGSHVDGTEAVVDVEITETYTDLPFEVSESSFEVTLVLASIEGDWRISEVPWPMFACPERNSP